MTALDSWHWAGEETRAVFSDNIRMINVLVLAAPIKTHVHGPYDGPPQRAPERPTDELFPGEHHLRANMAAADAADREELNRLLNVTRNTRER